MEEKTNMLLEAGAKIKQFTLDSRLGLGSSGEVWRAFDGDRPVAIKFMNPNLIESDRADTHRRRMEREVDALGRLSHPHIPALYDHDLDFERPYLAMQYIEGASYDKLITTKDVLRIPIKQRLDVLGYLADALQTAHLENIIHRDIKPGNMKGIEQPYLLDFSIAVDQVDVEHTRFDIGTAIYMPPDDGPPDQLSDNYSFAIATYEILFGEHPIFSADDKMREHLHAVTRFAAYNRLMSDDWRMPSKILMHELPPDLQGAKLEAMDKIFQNAMGERADRFTDLRKLIDDLRETILVPENEMYLDTQLPPLEPGTMEYIQVEPNFTFIEAGKDEKPTEEFVEIIGAKTDVGEDEQPSRLPYYIAIAVGVLVVLAFGAMLLSLFR